MAKAPWPPTSPRPTPIQARPKQDGPHDPGLYDPGLCAQPRLTLSAGFGCAGNRPLHAEFVGEVSVMIAPKLLFERHGDPPARGQRIEQRLGRAAVVSLDENLPSLHRLLL